MRAMAAEAEGARLEARAAHELAVAGPRAETIAQAEAEVAVQRAVAERLRDQVQKHTVIARFAGYVVAEHTEEGAWVSRGGPVAEVVALDEVEVIAQVVEGDVPFIVPGQEVEVEVTALPGESFRGEVVVTVPQADSRSRTFPVKVRVKNRVRDGGPLLKPGMLARVTLPVGAQQTATLAPKDAVVLGGRSPVVFVVDSSGDVGSEGKARAVPVELGAASGSLIQVSGELRPGERVVVEGNERLRPDQPVRVGRVVPTPAESL
jgi:RND family efflux transporter MFP subunit